MALQQCREGDSVEDHLSSMLSWGSHGLASLVQTPPSPAGLPVFRSTVQLMGLLRSLSVRMAPTIAASRRSRILEVGEGGNLLYTATASWI